MRTKSLMLAAAFASLSTGTAMADQILGRWCAPGGVQSIQVEAARVISPGGKPVAGNITRHSVDFIIPAGEKNAGMTFAAQQLNDEQIRVMISPKGGTAPTEIWTPCKPVS